MVSVAQFTSAAEPFAGAWAEAPWTLAERCVEVTAAMVRRLDDQFVIDGDVATHSSAQVHPSVTTDGPVVVGPNASVGPNVHLRGGVFIDAHVRVGPSCEVKSTWIMRGSALAHLNYVGNSVVGADVNIEAGAVIANHFNEREDKAISVLFEGEVIETGATKFGAMIGDGARIGANAVTSPGTLLLPGSIVGRLGLVEQISTKETTCPEH